jgi:YidC/Oxa1 family membrane protein insertase
MEKRVLIAVVLSFIVLYAYQVMFPPPKPAPGSGAGAPKTSPSASSTVTSSIPPTNPTAATTQQAAEATPASPTSAAPVVADTAERDIPVESSSISAVFTTRGGVLKSWRLKNYQDAARQPLELIPHSVPSGTTRPFTLSLGDQASDATLASALFKPSVDRIDLASGQSTLTFEYTDASGLTAKKEFVFSADQPYTIEFSANVQRSGKNLQPTVQWGPGIGSGVPAGSSSYDQAPQPIFYRDGSVSRISPGKVAEHAVQDGVLPFAGVDDHYFLTATLPGPQPIHVEYRTLDVPMTGGTVAHFVDWSARYNVSPAKARYFLGPKDFDVLAAVDRDLVRSINFGMFAWLVVPLLRALKWVNGYVGNYGWSIIILTILINIVMFPLRHKSVVSMRKMQEIQPQVKAIQDRYANLKMTDPAKQKMNTELMSLYREAGVNPASGCVPMLLTFPVLLAFYAMLSVAIELRGAPFIGWIHDLSVRDPLYITPVLMGITQVIQTKMTPTTGDAMQQRMMLLMPLIMMSWLLFMPSGLVVYWTTSNLWAIGQQALTNRLIGPMKPRAVRPPAERRMKNVGGSRTDQAVKERK